MAHAHARRRIGHSTEMIKNPTDARSSAPALGRRPLFVLTVCGLVIGLLVAAVPLALAVPTDPTWTPGLYDNGDYDEVVDALLATDAVPVAFSHGNSAIEATLLAPTDVEQTSVNRPRDVTPSRAPPLV